MRMELIENLLQLLVTFVGALLSGISYRKSGRQAYFLLLCFYGCFALGALYWTLYLLLFQRNNEPQYECKYYVQNHCYITFILFHKFFFIDRNRMEIILQLTINDIDI